MTFSQLCADYLLRQQNPANKSPCRTAETSIMHIDARMKGFRTHLQAAVKCVLCRNVLFFSCLEYFHGLF